MTPKKVCKCGRASIPGLVRNVALCQFHYTERQWGTAWAEECARLENPCPLLPQEIQQIGNLPSSVLSARECPPSCELCRGKGFVLL